MITRTELKNAVTQYTYWADVSDSPLGIFWVRHGQGQNGEQVSLLLNVMVVHYFKRHKVATELLDEILKHSDIMITLSGSAEGGEDLLRDYGFKYNDDIKLWIFKKGD